METREPTSPPGQGGEARQETAGQEAPELDESDDERAYKCPVCSKEFGAGNQMQYHHEAEHSVRDPELVKGDF